MKKDFYWSNEKRFLLVNRLIDVALNVDAGHTVLHVLEDRTKAARRVRAERDDASVAEHNMAGILANAAVVVLLRGLPHSVARIDAAFVLATMAVLQRSPLRTIVTLVANDPCDVRRREVTLAQRLPVAKAKRVSRMSLTVSARSRKAAAPQEALHEARNGIVLDDNRVVPDGAIRLIQLLTPRLGNAANRIWLLGLAEHSIEHPLEIGPPIDVAELVHVLFRAVQD